MIQLAWTALSDGWTQAPEAIVLPGGSWSKKLRFHAVAFLLQHPHEGPVLVDAGYSVRFFSESINFPNRLYRAITPVTLTDPEGIAGQIRRRGILPEEVRHLVITHFHADHIGGLRDFPNATVHCSERAWQSVRKLKGLAAVRKAFFPGLLPPDLENRLHFVEEGSDLFDDGAIRVLDLPGHAPGQIGIRFTETSGSPILLAADACWTSAAYRDLCLPHPVTRLLNEWKSYRMTLERLHRLHHDEPDLLILPTHCPETAGYLE